MRFAPVLVAAALGTTAALVTNAVLPAITASAPSVPLTRDSGWVHGSTLAPIATLCPSSTTAAAQMYSQRVAGRTYRFTTLVNGVTTRSGSVAANSAGVVVVRAYVTNLKTSAVAMRLNDLLAVAGSVTPRCGALPTGYVASPPPTGTRGSTSAYSLQKNPNGTVTRWNPCDGVIHVRVNPTGGGAYAVNDVLAALASITAQTGLRFWYDGPTTFIPRSTNSAQFPAQLVVGWANRSQTDLLGLGAIGEGGWRASGSSTDGSTWTWKVTKGFVVVDPTAKLIPGFARGVSRGALLMHELVHALGLGHAADPLQVMSPVLSSSSYASWGSGDKAGMVQVGSTKGCVTAR